MTVLTHESPLMMSEGFPLEPKTQVSTGFIEWNGKILLLQRSKKEDQSYTWGIPGGKSEGAENPIEALRRELLEETGLELPRNTTFVKRLFVKIPKWEYSLNLFRCLLEEEPKITLSDEHKGYQWVKVNEFPELQNLLKAQEIAYDYVYGGRFFQPSEIIDQINWGNHFQKRVHGIPVSILARTQEVAAKQFNHSRVVITLLGTTGAGKGTQGMRLQDEFSLPHFSAGDLFRDEIRDSTDLGHMILFHDDRTKKERLTPDQIALGIMVSALTADECKQGFIVDGFPRTEGQAKSYNQTLLRPDDLHIAFLLHIEDNAVYERLTGRFICGDCGIQHRREDFPQAEIKQEAECQEPNCGGHLIKRIEDSKLDTITGRLNLYRLLNDAVFKEMRKRDEVYVIHQRASDTSNEVYRSIQQIVSNRLKGLPALSEGE